MSPSYITVAGGSRRPLLLPTSLLMILIVMMPPYTSAKVELKSLEPSNGFDIGSRMNITCRYDVAILLLEIRRNNTVVLKMRFDRPTGKFEISENTVGFKCNLPLATSNPGELFCWKTNLRCSDASEYKCQSDNEVSISKSLKVKSSIESLELINPPYKLNKISTFTCKANVALHSSQNDVTFQWTVKHGDSFGVADRTEKRVSVPRVGQCNAKVQSEFEYNVTNQDINNTTITCEIFGQSLSKIVSISVDDIPPTAGPLTSEAGMDGGTIAGIVLGVIAFIILVVLLLWFFVIRKKKNKPDTKTSSGPPPNQKDYTIRENTVYSNTEKLKQSDPSLEMLADNHVYENDKAKGSRRQPKKGSKFLPSRGDATDQMDELDEPYPPPPPPPPMPDNSHPTGLHEQLHYAELELAVKDSRTRRSKYIPKNEIHYAEVEIQN